jgi:glucose/mannose-6-phosphate isomerase
MINLDDFQSFENLDTLNMLSFIEALPDQLQRAWELGVSLPLPEWDRPEQILIAGMGGSAIGADLVSAYVASFCPAPVTVHRDYGLPAWAKGPQTLVVASSHSGNTEETLSSFSAAVEAGCRVLTITTGGLLAELSKANNIPVWTFEHKGQPRSAVGWSFGLLLAALARLNLIPDQTQEIHNALAAMHEQQAYIEAQAPLSKNPAKRLAGQMVGRFVIVMGSGLLAPVARRWKGQVSELAKTWAQFEVLPEADHNTLAGTSNPEDLLPRTLVIFLRSSSDHPRNQLRSYLTRETFMLEGLGTDFLEAKGDSLLAQQWTCLHFGDYSAYYLAMLYGEDPTPIDALQSLKKALADSE